MDISSPPAMLPDLLDDGISFAAALPLDKKVALEKLPVELTDGYELPKEKVDENAPVLLKALDAETMAETGEAAVAPVGLLMTKLGNGEAEILEGSTDELIKIEIDGKIYYITGRFAELTLDAALQANGFFGHYITSYNFAGRGIILLDDGSEDQYLDRDLDGLPLHQAS